MVLLFFFLASRRKGKGPRWVRISFHRISAIPKVAGELSPASLFFPASRRHWTPLSLRTASANSARRLRTEFYRVSMVFFIQNSSTCNEPLLLAKPKVISLIEFCGTLVASLYFLAPFFVFFTWFFLKKQSKVNTKSRSFSCFSCKRKKLGKNSVNRLRGTLDSFGRVYWVLTE